MRESVPEKYILYADDDPDDQLLMSEVLAEINNEIGLITVESGQELITFLENLPPQALNPSLIVIDVNMPVLSGLETLIALRKLERFRKVPVILYTTGANVEDRDKALSLGAVAFVRKPSSYRELIPVIASFRGYFED